MACAKCGGPTVDVGCFTETRVCKVCGCPAPARCERIESMPPSRRSLVRFPARYRRNQDFYDFPEEV